MRSMLRRGAAEALDANRIPGPRGWCISVAALRRARRRLGPLPNACPCCDRQMKIPQPTAVYDLACQACETVWRLTCRATEAKTRWERMAQRPRKHTGPVPCNAPGWA
jgi:hypothetical protein